MVSFCRNSTPPFGNCRSRSIVESLALSEFLEVEERSLRAMAKKAALT
jgi:hypothetical protein